MRSERQLNDLAAEAGGVLLGRYIVGCEDIVIDDVTTPFGEDERGRFFFRRSQAPHQAAINERWTASDGRCHYLGEWHTHPESDPHASRTDVGDWKRRLKADIFDADSLLFIIVGTDVVRLWEGRRTRSVLWNCSIINPLRFDREGPR
jgi:integrative and conjugative element protein (TIGR02256 family)